MLGKRSVCVITGASKGLGRCIAEMLSLKLPSGSLFILMARNGKLLDEVANTVSSRDGIQAVTAVFDQGCHDQAVFNTILEEALAKSSHSLDDNYFEQALLINNASTLEPLDFVRSMDSVSSVSSYFNINVTGTYVLTSKFLQLFNTSAVGMRVIINISSLAALVPMKSWSLYCMAKAARDMLMKNVASEEEKIRTLNYAPGPLQTKMTETAKEETKDPELKKWFTEQIDGQKLLECEVTTKRLLDILSKDTFENGCHIDYFDEVQ